MPSRFHDERKGHAFAGPDRRTHDPAPERVEPVVLTRKFADAIDGINLGGHQVGDRLPLSPRDAELLIAEGWAEPMPPELRRRARSGQAEAADYSPRHRNF
jgi:hypothetical protein